jgi:hypothetical protein
VTGELTGKRPHAIRLGFRVVTLASEYIAGIMLPYDAKAIK